MKYRKKQIVVEANQFHYCRSLGGKWAICKPVDGVRGAHTLFEKFIDWWEGCPVYYCDTFEGTFRVRSGDWIIRGIAGEYYPCRPDIFQQTYELAEPVVGK